MRTGVLAGSRSFGGTYQYSQAVLDALSDDACRAGDDIVILTTDFASAEAALAHQRGWQVATPTPELTPTLARRARNRVSRRLFRPQTQHARPDLDAVNSDPRLERWLRGLGIELMLYPVPLKHAIAAGLPFVIAVHDLQHRLQPEFPEVSANGEAEARERLYRNAARRATLVIAESETGKEDLLACYGEYGLEEERIRILPYVPTPSVLEHSAQDEAAPAAGYSLPDRYLFYPAQFWPHKNHLRLVEAVALLKREHGLDVPLVLCGSHDFDLPERTHAEMVARAAALGIDDRIHDLGYVPDGHVRSLYAGAVALVMPTFFGPTNIPIVEAWACGCPVLTSDIRGVREQAKDAAVLVDPRSIESIANGITRLWTDDRLRKTLVEHGRRRLAELSPEAFRVSLDAILQEAAARVRTEGRRWAS